jgi:DNA helicase II / ATP-dependent DNA helicase PcrA
MDQLTEQLELIGAREGTNEWRIFGPPGCGKTTHTSRQITRAVEKYGPDAILITSFSRAAAAELVGRDLPVPREKIGTLHAHCYRALGRPPIAEVKVSDWNETYPSLRVKGGTEGNLDEPMEEIGANADGDELLAEANRWRNRRVPPQYWTDPRVKRFYQMWCEWKDSHGLLDFTDLLERAILDIRIAPGDPRVIFADEAQDFTRLQLDLVRKWGEHTDYFLVVGDDDQTIYTFTGATPDAFLTPEVPEEQKIVLSQSYRVPQAVHALAVRWIEQVQHRHPKEYRPTREPGEIVRAEGTTALPGSVIGAAEREIARGKTVMFLTSCSYMLQQIRQILSDRGIPFHNPYRRRRGDWNPLFSSHGVSAGERVLAYLRPHHSQGDKAVPWNATEYQKWADWLDAKGTFKHGRKTAAKSLKDGDIITIDTLHEWLEPEAFDALIRGVMAEPVSDYLFWWLKRVSKSHAKTAGYPVRVAALHGLEALRDRPKVIIGTIHSVKGGEADVVYLFPDLSRPAANEWDKPGEHRDAIVRQFYVGMTRARHKLVICAPTNYMRVDL